MPKPHRHRKTDEDKDKDLPPCTCGIPEPPRTVHPESDPNESMRRELTQCQYCWKSQGEGGITLKKCAACRVEVYCSPECQKKAWPSHKTKCKLNQRIIEAGDSQFADFKLLRAFTSKHRPTLAEHGILALDLAADPTRCLRDVLLISLAYRPESHARTETSFYAVAADVVPLDTFGQADEMRGQLMQANEDQKRKSGMMGTFFVVLTCFSSSKLVSNIAPVGFHKRSLYGLKPGMPWKEGLMRKLNEGIVT